MYSTPSAWMLIADNTLQIQLLLAISVLHAQAQFFHNQTWFLQWLMSCVKFWPTTHGPGRALGCLSYHLKSSRLPLHTSKCLLPRKKYPRHRTSVLSTWKMKAQTLFIEMIHVSSLLTVKRKTNQNAYLLQ